MAWVGLAVCLVACGAPGAHAAGAKRHSPSPVASTSPNGSARSLFAVLESDSASGPPAHGAVALVDASGIARARATFTPRQAPALLGGVAALGQEAQVTSGGVDYVDGAGTVRELASSGVVSTVAAFQLTPSQQEMSFAVSPDGATVVAAVLTLPPPPSPAAASAPATNQPLGAWVLEIQVSKNGSDPVVLHRWTSLAQPGLPGSFPMVQLVGWDEAGPVALVGGSLSVPVSPLPGQTLFGGRLANVDLGSGIPSATTLGGCEGGAGSPWSVSPAGYVVCVAGGGEVSVRGASAGPLYSFQTASGTGSFSLSPDASMLAMDRLVLESNGHTHSLPPAFEPRGWIATNILIGALSGGGSGTCGQDPELGVASAAGSASVRDLGLCGTFVGTLGG